MKKKLFYRIKTLILCVIVLILCASCSQQKEESAGAKPQKFEDLKPYKSAYMMGSTTDLLASKTFAPEKVFRLNSVAEMFAAVESKTVDYTVMDSAMVIGSGLKERGLEVCFCLDDRLATGVGFRKDETEIQGQFNEFLRQMHETGAYDSVYHRWMTDEVLTATMPKFSDNATGTPLRVATSGSCFPTSFKKNGEWAGLECELLYRFGQYIGRPIELYNYEFGAMIAALNSRKVDAICNCICVTEERKKVVLFSDPVFYTVSIAIGRAESGEKAQVGFWQKLKTSFVNNLVVEDRWKLLLDGLWETIYISLFSILFGVLVGCVICALRMSRRKVLRGAAIAYVEIMRGVPILVFLMVMFYVVFATSRLTATWVAIIAFSCNFGAYVSEMFRSGINSVDKGQVEAGRAMGFGSWNTFTYFVAPQALRSIFPVFKGEAISLIKNTSVVGYIAIQDLTKASDLIRSRTFDAFFPLIVISIIYFVLAWLLGIGLEALNKKTSSKPNHVSKACKK